MIQSTMTESQLRWCAASHVTSMLQIFGMAFVVFGDGLLETFGLSTGPNPPDWVKKAKDNKVRVIVASHRKVVL